MGLSGVGYQGTHTYLPNEMSNDSDSSDDVHTCTSVHTGCTYTRRKREKATEGGGRGSNEVTWLVCISSFLKISSIRFHVNSLFLRS